jgi:hypothetical protein
MPIHDWTRVPAGLFHDFHQTWSIHLKTALNAGRLPRGFSALVEQRAGGREPDVLAIEERLRTQQGSAADPGGVLTLTPPTTQMVFRTTREIYARRANRIVVRHHLGRIVAVVEILSPGNKDSRAAIRDFVDKTVGFLHEGVHALLIDLFPPTLRDPLGIHQLIWTEITDEPFAFPPGKDRILASYEAGEEKSAYVEPLALNDNLPDMPLFLASGMHVKVPLQATYLTAWDACSAALREAVEAGHLPQSDAE